MMLETQKPRSLGVEQEGVFDAEGPPRGSPPPRDILDWASFSAAFFPGRRRHDLEALTAYGAYRSARDLDARSGDGP
jgi:hypothetical protein